MSTVSIKKNVDVSGYAEIDIEVYSVKCYCGAKLGFDAEADSDGDITVTVEEHKCVQEKE